MPIEVRPDPIDGLPAMQAGDWAVEKHELVRKYLDISRHTRRKWIEGPGGATYIELFSGPSRLFTKGTDNFFDGSPLVAHREAVRTGAAFTAMHLGDERKDFCDASAQRLGALGANPITYPGTAEKMATSIVNALSPHSLNFAFLDPFGFEGLPFSVVETFAPCKYMDLLIHVSASSLQRNLSEFIASKNCPLDDFAPDWRKVVAGRRADDIARGMILDHWIGLMKKVGLKAAKGMPLIRGPDNQALYWLVLVAKHDLAVKFWDAINKPKQGDLFNR